MATIPRPCDVAEPMVLNVSAANGSAAWSRGQTQMGELQFKSRYLVEDPYSPGLIAKLLSRKGSVLLLGLGRAETPDHGTPSDNMT